MGGDNGLDGMTFYVGRWWAQLACAQIFCPPPWLPLASASGSAGNGGITVLCLAAANGHTGVVTALLDARADPNEEDPAQAPSHNYFFGPCKCVRVGMLTEHQ